ncbi:MAG: zinc finger domain-containing protein [Coriobacteriia bacterium]
MKSPKAKRPRCKQCRGYGVVREIRQTIIGRAATIVTCPRCGGSKIEPRHNPDLETGI